MARKETQVDFKGMKGAAAIDAEDEKKESRYRRPKEDMHQHPLPGNSMEEADIHIFVHRGIYSLESYYKSPSRMLNVAYRRQKHLFRRQR
jgi:hypothetical protein